MRKNEMFKSFVHDIALHIVVANPAYVNIDEVPADEIEKERDL